MSSLSPVYIPGKRTIYHCLQSSDFIVIIDHLANRLIDGLSFHALKDIIPLTAVW